MTPEVDRPRAVEMLTEHCVFEATSPAPDGTRVVGPGAIREAWAPVFADPDARFTVEDTPG